MSAAPMLWGRPRCSLRWRRRHRGSLGDGGDLATAAIAVAIAVAVAALAALAAISITDGPVYRFLKEQEDRAAGRRSPEPRRRADPEAHGPVGLCAVMFRQLVMARRRILKR